MSKMYKEGIRNLNVEKTLSPIWKDNNVCPDSVVDFLIKGV